MADEPKSVDTGSSQLDVAANATPEPKPQPPAAAPSTATEPEHESGDQPDASNDAEAVAGNGESAGDEGKQQAHGEPGKQNTPRGVQKRLDKLTREKYEAQAQAQQAAAELARLRAQIQQPAKPTQAQPVAGKPTLESCNNDPETYLESLAEWKAKEIIDGREKQRQAQEQQAKAAQQRASHAEREKAFVEAHPDYYDAAYQAPINYSPAMLDYITTSEKGPDVAYHLAQHLDEAKAIEQLPEHRKALALYQIEQKLAAPQTPSVPVRTVTQAPQPPATIAPSGHARRDVTDPSLSTSERIAIWRKRKSA